MGINKNYVSTDGLNAGVQTQELLIGIPLAAAATLAVGTPIMRDVTALPGGILPLDVTPSKVFFNARVSDRGVLPTSSNAGDILGIYQGVGFQGLTYTNNSGTTAIYVAPCRMQGLGRVLAGAVSAGTAVTIGSTLVTTSSNTFATVGSRAIGTAIGRVVAYAVNTTIAAAISTGSQTVTPASMIGITTSTALVIDTGSGQEVVVPTAVTATTFTATFTIAHTAPVTVQGITSTAGATIIQVPGSGSTTGIVFCDINVTA